MKSGADHLPEQQQSELALAIRIVREEFERAIAGGTQPWRRNGKILKIILFGSYARNDWVDEPDNGYQSDFDLLIVVSHPALTDVADYWYVAEDRVLHDPAIGRQVNIIIHDLDEVNQALTRGEYFWIDIARDGIALYEMPGSALGTPKPLTPADAYDMAASYYSDWLGKIGSALKLAKFAQLEREKRDAAFLLHQATERAYACFLLTRSFYFPRSHNVKFLRSLAEDMDVRLVDAWPRSTRIDRRRFELLKRAYVEARYSDSYEVSVEDLDWLAEGVARLREIVAKLGAERLATLRADAVL